MCSATAWLSMNIMLMLFRGNDFSKRFLNALSSSYSMASLAMCSWSTVAALLLALAPAYRATVSENFDFDHNTKSKLSNWSSANLSEISYYLFSSSCSYRSSVGMIPNLIIRSWLLRSWGCQSWSGKGFAYVLIKWVISGSNISLHSFKRSAVGMSSTDRTSLVPLIRHSDNLHKASFYYCNDKGYV